MSIYSNDNIIKIAKLTTRELPQKSKNAKITVRENNGLYSIWKSTSTNRLEVSFKSLIEYQPSSESLPGIQWRGIPCRAVPLRPAISMLRVTPPPRQNLFLLGGDWWRRSPTLSASDIVSAISSSFTASLRSSKYNNFIDKVLFFQLFITLILVTENTDFELSILCCHCKTNFKYNVTEMYRACKTHFAPWIIIKFFHYGDWSAWLFAVTHA